ncbi:hypothetical protein EDEG_01792 [Edhazardia aedis USNM 41457]|uniref:Uncharacterized protein n=1 Tax=Edhazardia aedis (strain USNM 41457) TaxID=1003232 RepID=J9D8S7_EDHAE|nr:hypothetical protein EDEG_01792 [Edhazardia aedis USNM 41457]|eukprot:EJW03914.1 hypothetical protein EDEG_01792 [Edhazardia aedis USNM 41457]
MLCQLLFILQATLTTQGDITESSTTSPNIHTAEKFLFEDLEIDAALESLSHINTPRSHLLQFFIYRNFKNDNLKALCHLVAAEDDSSQSLIVAHNSYFIIDTVMSTQKICSLFFKQATKIYKEYNKNKFRFKEKVLFKDLKSQTDLENSFEDFVNLVDAGDAKAQSFFLSNIESGKIEPAKYENILKKLSKEGNAKASAVLGEMFYEGRGVQKCPATAMHYFSRGVMLKDPVCLNGMGKIYYKNLNYGKAKNYFEEASKNGSLEASYRLYKLYRDVYSLEQMGIIYLINSANKGYLPAIYAYAMKFYQLKQFKEAIQFFGGICDQSLYVMSILDLAEKYFLMDDVRTSLIYLMFCAEYGSTFAMKNILYLLNSYKDRLQKELNGIMDVNSLIFRFNRNIADMGYKTHIIELGNCYFYGIGTEKSYEDAFAFYLSASMDKNSEGAYSVSYMYEHGLGIAKNLNQAFKYIKLAYLFDEKAYIVVWVIYIKLWIKYFFSLIFGSSTNGLIFTVLVGMIGLRVFLHNKILTNRSSKNDESKNYQNSADNQSLSDNEKNNDNFSMSDNVSNHENSSKDDSECNQENKINDDQKNNSKITNSSESDNCSE